MQQTHVQPLSLGSLTRESLSTMLIFLPLMAAFSQLSIPLWPVPITGQTFFCLAMGLWFSSSFNGKFFLTYILLGLAGLPFFHGFGGGLGYLMAPSFGYIVGMPVAAVVFASLRPRLKGVKSFFFWAFIADLAPLALGVTYLNWVLGGVVNVWFSGFLVFLPGEFLKIMALYGIWRFPSR